MKKSNKRRRLIISSVAMLMVAMLALGSATYAWFTNSTTAAANGINVSLAAPQGLLISVDGGASFASSVNASLTGATLSPASGNCTIGSTDMTFYKSSLDGATLKLTASQTAAGDSIVVPNTTNTAGYYICISAQVKLSSGT
ncbi:MAG: hypothetical protein Q8876_07820, partial [Bacillota bacterium]|nr:hypothetical protein [Bacillota bacterium]